MGLWSNGRVGVTTGGLSRDREERALRPWKVEHNVLLFSKVNGKEIIYQADINFRSIMLVWKEQGKIKVLKIF